MADQASVNSIGEDGLPVNTIESIGGDTEEIIEKMDEEDQTDKEDKDSSMIPNRVRRFATIMNLLNSLLGAGILSVPSSFKNNGVFPSMVILLFIALLSYYATVMVVKLQIDTKSAGYDELVFDILGKIGQTLFSTFSLIFLTSALLAYLILGGDMIISWFSLIKIDLNRLWPRAFMILIYAIAIPIAISLPRSIGFLSYFSTATVFFILFFTLAMIVKGIDGLPNGGVSSTVVYSKIDSSVFSSISIYGLAFSLPIVTPAIVHPYNPDLHKRKVVSFVATLICFFLVAIPSIIGYLLFGDKTQGNILKSFPDNDGLMIIVRIGFFFIVSFSYPIVAQVVQGSYSQFIYSVNDANSLPSNKRNIVLLVTHLIPAFLAMFLPEATPVLSVGGALGGCSVNFIYPAILWYTFYKLQPLSKEGLLCILLFLFGGTTAVISTYQAVIDMIKSFKAMKK